MKNPFKKSDHTILIAGIAIASVAAGTLAYLFLSDSGNETRKSIKKKIKKIAKDAAKEIINKKTLLSKKVSEVVAHEATQ